MPPKQTGLILSRGYGEISKRAREGVLAAFLNRVREGDGVDAFGRIEDAVHIRHECVAQEP